LHIEQVLGDVPREQRCPGHAAPPEADKPKVVAPPPSDRKRT
jgi:hypothetical protein